jgi:hypothetical protein
VAVAGAVLWYVGKTQQTFRFQGLQVVTVYLLDAAAALGDAVKQLRLDIDDGSVSPPFLRL